MMMLDRCPQAEQAILVREIMLSIQKNVLRASSTITLEMTSSGG
jgi:hypothetical protein